MNLNLTPKLEHLQSLIRDGDKAIEQGNFTGINSDKELETFFASF